MSDVELLKLEQRRAKRGMFFRALLYVPGFLLVYIVVTAICALAGLGRIGSFLPFLLGFAAAFALAAPFVRRTLRSRRVVVWLRRFHRPEMSTFETMVNTTCKGLAVPITLQDTSVRFSLAFIYAAPGRGLSLVLIFIGTFALIVWLSDLSYDLFHDVLGYGARALPFIILALLATLALKKIAERLGLLRLTDDDDGVERVHCLLTEIKEKSSNLPLVVLSVPDKTWQLVVAHCLKVADAVLVDVTDFSENLRWELQTCSKYLRPEQLVMVLAAGGQGESQLPGNVKSALEDIFGTAGNNVSFIIVDTSPRGLGRELPGVALWMTVRRYQPQFLSALARAFKTAGSL